MHQENLKDAIFVSIFDNEQNYRKHYVPIVRLAIKNPKKATERIHELVDNVTMRFCKDNNLSYSEIPREIKDEIAIDLHNEIIQNEVNRSR